MAKRIHIAHAQVATSRGATTRTPADLATARPVREGFVMVGKRALRNAARLSLVATALVVAVMWSDMNDDARAVRPDIPTGPASMLEAHDCWTGEQPSGVEAGHVVVTRRGAGAPTYGGQRLTGKALEQTSYGIDHGFTVHGYCR